MIQKVKMLSPRHDRLNNLLLSLTFGGGGGGGGVRMYSSSP